MTNGIEAHLFAFLFIELDNVFFVGQELYCLAKDLRVSREEVDVIEISESLSGRPKRLAQEVEGWSEGDRKEKRTERITLSNTLGRLEDSLATNKVGRVTICPFAGSPKGRSKGLDC